MAGTIQVSPLLIAPSLLSCDPLNIGSSIASLAGNFDWLHVDVMDGHFVPNLSYGPALVAALKKRFPDAPLDVHLMTEPGEDFLDMFLASKPAVLTVHQEACRHLHRALTKIKESDVIPGVALNPSTPVEMLEPVLSRVGLVLLMSVNPGFSGQSFIPEVTDKAVKLCRLREARGLDFLIEMDGGISAANIAQVRRCGVDVAVMGNAVFAAESPADAVTQARELAAQA